KDALRAAEITF
ncbi:putative zinc finger protein, partial [Plasmodium gaboni]